MKNITLGAISLASALALTSMTATAGPPIGSQSFSTLVKLVEEKNLGQIMDAEFDDDLFEVKVCQSQRNCQELKLNPRTGQEVSRKADDTSEQLPPANAKALSEIIASVEARELGIITEAEFDDGLWEIEIRGVGIKTELKIDPVTGEQTAG